MPGGATIGYRKLTEQDSVPIIAPQVPLDTFTPNPKMHLYVSLTKSVIRIGGYLLILGINHGLWGILVSSVLVFSEVIGIVEELV